MRIEKNLMFFRNGSYTTSKGDISIQLRVKQGGYSWINICSIDTGHYDKNTNAQNKVK